MAHLRGLRHRLLVFLIVLTGSFAGAPLAAQESGRSAADSLLAAPQNFEGRYVRNEAVYTFSAKPALAALAEAMPEAALPLLIDCLDSEAPSRVTLEAAPLPLGQVCYELLRLLAYHEAVGAQGGLRTGRVI